MYIKYRLIDTSTPDNIDIMPERANPTDAGLDLKAKNTTNIKWGTKALVDTGFSVQIPPGFMGLLVPRSSTPKKGLKILNSPGIIDSDYRGTIRVNLMAERNSTEHFASEAVEIVRGEKIAQLIIVPIVVPRLVDCSGVSDDVWINTDRGIGGFGSSGL